METERPNVSGGGVATKKKTIPPKMIVIGAAIVIAVCVGIFFVLRGIPATDIVRQTAFDYMKELGSGTVETYYLQNGTTASVSFKYEVEDDVLCIQYNQYEEGAIRKLYDLNAWIYIPSSLTGEYRGSLLDMRFNPVNISESTYSVDASTFTADTKLTAVTCDDDFRVTFHETMYATALRAMVINLYNKVLAPNGYTYADLGFYSYR